MDTIPDHNKKWLNNIHPAPVNRNARVYDLAFMQPFEIIRGCDEGILSTQDKKVYDRFIKVCREHHEGPLKDLFRKEAVRLFSHFIK